MNLFSDAKMKERINNLPYKYNLVRRGRIIKVTAKNLTSVTLNNHLYILSAFDVEGTGATVFKDFTDFHLFVYDNFFKLSELVCNKLTVSYKYKLKNGFLHSETGYAYQKFNKTNDLVEGVYYLNGREIDDELFKHLLREKKLNRITETKNPL